MILTHINRTVFLNCIRNISEQTLIPMKFSPKLGARLKGDSVSQFDVEEERKTNSRLNSLLAPTYNGFGESDNFPVIVEYGDVQHVFMASQTMLNQAQYVHGADMYVQVFLERDKSCFGVSWKSTSKTVTIGDCQLSAKEYLSNQKNFNAFVEDLRETIGDDPADPLADRIRHVLRSTDNKRMWLSLDNWAGPKLLQGCIVSDTPVRFISE